MDDQVLAVLRGQLTDIIAGAIFLSAVVAVATFLVAIVFLFILFFFVWFFPEEDIGNISGIDAKTLWTCSVHAQWYASRLLSNDRLYGLL